MNKILFWTSSDLQNKLDKYQFYFNSSRCHWGIDRVTPHQKAVVKSGEVINLKNYRWKKHCRGLFDLPVAA